MFLIHKMHYQYPENIIQLIYYTLYSLTLFSEDDMLLLIGGLVHVVQRDWM